MKNVILFFLTVFAATLTIMSKDIRSTTSPQTSASNEVLIDPSELPKAVKTTLLYDLFNDLKVTSVVSVKGEVEYFLIELSKNDEKQFIKVNKDGQVIS